MPFEGDKHGEEVEGLCGSLFHSLEKKNASTTESSLWIKSHSGSN